MAKSDWFASVVSGFEAVPSYVIECFSDVGALVSSSSIDPVINYLLHDEVLRGCFFFRFRVRCVVVLVHNLFFRVFSSPSMGGLAESDSVSFVFTLHCSLSCLTKSGWFLSSVTWYTLSYFLIGRGLRISSASLHVLAFGSRTNLAPETAKPNDRVFRWRWFCHPHWWTWNGLQQLVRVCGGGPRRSLLDTEEDDVVFQYGFGLLT